MTRRSYLWLITAAALLCLIATSVPAFLEIYETLPVVRRTTSPTPIDNAGQFYDKNGTPYHMDSAGTETSLAGSATPAGTGGQVQINQGGALAGASIYNVGTTVYVVDPISGSVVLQTVSTGVSAQLKGGALYGVQLYTPLLMAFPLNGISGSSTFLPETLESFAVTGVTFALPGLIVGPAGVSIWLNDMSEPSRLLYNVTIPAGATRYVSATGTTTVPKGTAIIVVEGTWPSGTSVGTVQFSGTRN